MKKIRHLFILIVGLFLFIMFLGATFKYVYFSEDQGKRRLGIIGPSLKYIGELPYSIRKFFKPEDFLIKNTSLGDGLHYFGNSDTYKEKLLITYKFAKYKSIIDLVDLQSGDVIKKWTPDNKMIFEKAYNPNNPIAPPTKDSDLFYSHPLMLQDSSLLLHNVEHGGFLAKIDKENKLIWIKNDRNYHHSSELDHEGNVYICTRPFISNNYDILPEDFSASKSQKNISYWDDHITKINPKDGSILFERSVTEILISNGFEDLLLANGQFSYDAIHLNDIQPALNSSDYWEIGDLLISCRNLSTVFLFRPSTNEIIWLKSHPWLNQHDADFVDKNKILVFGNDVIRDVSDKFHEYYLTDEKLFFNKKRQTNNAYIYDFELDTITTPFQKLFESNSIRTLTEGRCDLLENGDLYIEETDHGRIIIGDSVTKKAEFAKRVDINYVTKLHWSRIIK